MRWRAPALLSLILAGCPTSPEDEEVCEDVHSGLAGPGDKCRSAGAQCSYGDDCGWCTYACEDGEWVLVGCGGECDSGGTTQTGSTTETSGGETVDDGVDTDTGVDTGVDTDAGA